MIAGIDLNIVLAVLAGAIMVAAFFWPTLRDETRRRTQAERQLAEARGSLSAQPHDGTHYRELFDALLDAFPLPVIVTNRTRMIVFANRAALRLVHMPSHRVIGRLLASIIQDYDTAQLLLEATGAGAQRERTFQRATTGETWRVIVTPMRVQGNEMEEAQRVGPRESIPPVAPATGAATHLILTIEDLTELRRLEIVRSDFVAHVSHELRTPLAALKLLAETLEGAIERDPPAARLFTQRISGEIDHLALMVAELLELSRIESGKIEPRLEPTDLAGLIEAVIDRMRPLARERGVTLSATVPDGLPDALADAGRLGEVLINLIHNGLKYTPLSGRVVVSAALVDGEAHDERHADEKRASGKRASVEKGTHAVA
ncbi:MAG: PAS domain-containing protein, partial [Ktedonobacterales bacterium]|nr:PAS domain-containing protein [Ktedonobacterales bacterium]